MKKVFDRQGIAGVDFPDKDAAAGSTYVTNKGDLFSTPLIFAENPFNENVKNAKFILDVGCGVGRNLKWIMENTQAHYVGLDPNLSMLGYFWDLQDEKYKNRVTLITSLDVFENISIKFDIVVCTFVFQHIGYRVPEGVMNIADITKEVFQYSTDNTVWIMYEHEWEEPDWIARWCKDIGMKPVVYIKNWNGIPELTHRGLHDLIIMQGIGETE